MSRFTVFIDGQEGTTGLQIVERIKARDDVSLLEIAPEKRKDLAARKELLNAADVAFLCLPDDAAIQAASLVENERTILIDASTAHRTNDAWAYGLPELGPAQRSAIQGAKRIANPGCYATGMLALTHPLVAAGILPKDYPLTVHAVSGYSGAGKKGIAQYEDPQRSGHLNSPRLYALGLAHKHLPEMQLHAGLSQPPIFNPQICDFYAGMTVNIPLHTRLLSKTASPQAICQLYQEHYRGQNFVSFAPAPEDGFIPATLNTGTNRLTIFVGGNSQQLIVSAVLDNLGKGASGAAVQNMNIALSLDETLYLK